MPRHDARALVMVLAVALALSGCAVRLVADYDAATEDALLRAYEKINALYDRLAESPLRERDYGPLAERYGAIETDLRVLLLRQRGREANSESIGIAERLLESWQSTRAEHKRRSAAEGDAPSAYPDSLIALDRQQFDDHFKAAIAAEQAKK